MKNIFKALLLLFTACNVSAQQKDQVSTEEFEKLALPVEAQLLDVRRPDEFQEGHIKNAKLADWQNKTQFKQKVAQLDKTKPVYVYCKAGIRGSKAQDWLIKNGFTRVINLEGGIDAWKAAGKPVIKEP